MGQSWDPSQREQDPSFLFDVSLVFFFAPFVNCFRIKDNISICILFTYATVLGFPEEGFPP